MGAQRLMRYSFSLTNNIIPPSSSDADWQKTGVRRGRGNKLATSYSNSPYLESFGI